MEIPGENDASGEERIKPRLGRSSRAVIHKCDPWTSSIGILEVVWNAILKPHFRPEVLGPSDLGFRSSQGGWELLFSVIHRVGWSPWKDSSWEPSLPSWQATWRIGKSKVVNQLHYLISDWVWATWLATQVIFSKNGGVNESDRDWDHKNKTHFPSQVSCTHMPGCWSQIRPILEVKLPVPPGYGDHIFTLKIRVHGSDDRCIFVGSVG